MDLKKFAPWNWFKKEEEHGVVVPVQQAAPASRHARDSGEALRAPDGFDGFFDSPFSGGGWPSFDIDRLLTPLTATDMLRPRVDIGASADEYTVTIEIPGVTENDITLEVSGDTLVVRGEKHQEKETKEKSYYRRERSYGSFERTLSLPEDADQENSTAIFKHGVLTIAIPRRRTEPHPKKRIQIHERQ